MKFYEPVIYREADSVWSGVAGDPSQWPAWRQRWAGVPDAPPARPAAAPSRDPLDVSLDPFRDALGGVNQGIFANQETVGGLADLLSGIGGQFGQFAQGEDPLLAMQREAAAGRLRGNLARQGITGTVAQNELNNLDQGFAQQQLAQRNQNLMSQAQLGQGAAGLLGMQNQFGNDYLQNLLALPQIQVAKTAADKAGKTGGGGGGGKSCAIICLVLTDELLRTGELDPALFLANIRYAQDRTTAEVYRGYRLWAEPLTGKMRTRPLVRRAVRWAVTRYCEQAAYVIGAGGRKSWAGRLLLKVVPALSTVAARLIPAAREVPLCPIYEGG